MRNGPLIPLSKTRRKLQLSDRLSPHVALRQAAAYAGSQGALARICGVSQPSVWEWLNKGKALPAEHVLKVEAATGVSRHDLRPDLYPREDNHQNNEIPCGRTDADNIPQDTASHDGGTAPTTADEYAPPEDDHQAASRGGTYLPDAEASIERLGRLAS